MGSVPTPAKCHARAKGEQSPEALACKLPTNASPPCEALPRADFPCVEEKNNPESKAIENLLWEGSQKPCADPFGLCLYMRFSAAPQITGILWCAGIK